MLKKYLSILCILSMAATIFSVQPVAVSAAEPARAVQQASIPAVTAFPDSPSPYQYMDWKQRALDYDAYVFDWNKTGDHLPTIQWDKTHYNMSYDTIKMPAYLGDTRLQADGEQEGINMLAAIAGATLSGVDKSNQDGINYVDLMKTFMHADNSRNLFFNWAKPTHTRNQNDWWYDLAPNLLYYMIAEKYPNDPNADNFRKNIADALYKMTVSLGGPSANFNHQSFNHDTQQPVDGTWKVPEAGVINGLVEYWAYMNSKDAKYLDAAKWSMNAITNQVNNPYYEVGAVFAPYIAARMNAEQGTHYNLDYLFQWIIKGSARKGWGTLLDTSWNGYDVAGLQGSTTDGNGYAFLMNTFATAFFAPAVKYDASYANVVGKWLLNVSNAARFFYADQMPAENQTYGSKYMNAPEHVIAYEGLRKQVKELDANGKEVYTDLNRINATGDPHTKWKNWGCGETCSDLGLYGSSWAGFFGAIFRNTNVEKILQIDLNALDFYKQENGYPTYLYYNPYATTQSVQIKLDKASDLFDVITGQYVARNVSGTSTFSVPAGNSVVLVVAPANGKLTYTSNQTLINSVPVAYKSGVERSLALGKPVTADQDNAANSKANVTDGDINTRWEAGNKIDTHWMYVDLGASLDVNRVVLNWEAASATGYKLQVSDDAANWTDVYSTTAGKGGKETVTFDTVNARYVKLASTKRATTYGLSLWEFEVFGPAETVVEPEEPAQSGAVDFAGDPDFDSDSIADSTSGQWRWLSYPGARMALNINKYDKVTMNDHTSKNESHKMKNAAGPMTSDLRFDIGGYLGAGKVRLFDLMDAKLAASGQSAIAAGSVSTTWYPYKITFDAAYNTPAGASVSGYDYFTAADSSAVRVLQVSGGGDKDLVLGGTVTGSGGAVWDADKQTLVVSDAGYYYALRFVGLSGEALSASVLNLTPTVSGSTWTMRIPVGADGGSYAVGFGFAAGSEGAGKAVSRAIGNFAQGVKASLAATKQVFDTSLRKAPAPQSFGIASGIDAKGVTPERHRMYYYGAFAFVLSNYMDVLPENTDYFNYPQALLGKASIWGNGGPYNIGSCAWESFFTQQWLSYMMPKEAWAAYAGTMSLVQADGYIPGEVLPSRKAQTAWVIYNNGGASKAELAEQYANIKRNLLWLEQNPRWIQDGGHNVVDEKDVEFMASFVFDADFAIKIAQEIGQPQAETDMWKARKTSVENDIRAWFLANPNKLNQYYFTGNQSYTVGVPESVLNALYADNLTDTENRMLVDYWRGMTNAASPVNGQIFKYPVISLDAYAMYNKGFAGDAKQIVYTGIRDIVRSGNFTEVLDAGGKLDGVGPSMFTAAAMIDFTLMANKVATYTGVPQAIDLGDAWGETSLPVIEDFNYVSDWSVSTDANISTTDGIAKVAVNTNAAKTWGHMGKRIAYNVSDNPMVYIKVTQVDPGANWSLKVNDGGEDIVLQGDTNTTGTFSYNLKTITGWTGSKSFVVKLYASGGKGRSFQVDYLGTQTVAPEVATDKQAYALGQSSKVIYKGAGVQDRIGIFKDDGRAPGESNPPLAVLPVGADADGIASFDGIWAPGGYRAILLKEGGYGIGASAVFYVSEPALASRMLLKGAIDSRHKLSGKLAISSPSYGGPARQYALYWGDEYGRLPAMEPFAVIEAGAGETMYEFDRAAVPAAAKSIVAASRQLGYESTAVATERLPQIGVQPVVLEDFADVTDWTWLSNAAISAADGIGQITVNAGSSYGNTGMNAIYDLTDLPLLRFKVEGMDSGAKWALKVNTQSFSNNGDITIQGDTTNTGEQIFNLRQMTGWSGAKSFVIKLYVSGGAGKSVRVSGLTAMPIDPVLGVPAAPTGVSALPRDGAAIVSFEPSADDGGSEVLKYTATAWTDGNAVLSAEGAASPITLSGLANGTAYTFTVTATNAQGDSPASTPSNEVIPAIQAPVAPVNLVAAAGDAQVALTWDAAADADSYAVYRYEGAAAPADAADWQLIGMSVTGTTYTVTGLANGKRYAFALKAANAGGESDYSAAAVATPTAVVPAAPAAPEQPIAVAGDGQVTLTWDAVAGADSYAVYSYEGATAPADAADWRLVKASVAGMTYTATGLANGKRYAFAVKAANAGGESDYSAAAVATPTAPQSETPGNPSVPVIDNAPIKSESGSIVVPVGRAGEVSLGDAVRITLPAGAADQELRITIEKLADTTQLKNGQGLLASNVYEILKNVAGSFKITVTLSLKFDPSTVGEGRRVAIFYYDETNKVWVEVGGKAEGNRITAEVNHFTKFAVLAVDVKPDDNGGTMEPLPTFSDIAGHWGEKAIRSAAGKKLVSGYPDGTFKPNKFVTRAEFTVMLMNALQKEAADTAPAFKDQDKIGAWAAHAVTQAVASSIVHGYEDGTFRPNAAITRTEMAVMIAKALGLPQDAAADTGFADDAKIPQWAKASVKAIHELGIVNGRGAGKFAPAESATRSEAVTMLLGMLEHQGEQ
ncbi:S-layer homology domain-containing protein [Cohnella sp. 56]|uniref:S-layer homology domain-containing protein n=1 Tax=Cohnella sp. 56 TaxID=3113722 RepID=UPI0030EA401F